jgi:hypothetical protein
MGRTALGSAAVVVLAFLTGCGSTPPAKPGGEGSADTVRALRYHRIVADSLLDWDHEGGRWVEELYFPERGVVATLDRESWYDEEEEEFKSRPRLYADFGAIGNKVQLSPSDVEETLQATEEVRVPGDLALEIEVLADLKKRVAELERLLGNRVAAEGILEDDGKPPAGAPSAEPREADL